MSRDKNLTNLRESRDVAVQTETVEEDRIITENCSCDLCVALANHLEELALTMGMLARLFSTCYAYA